MKKLEDISKQNIFEVPEGYFDKLPVQIQSRIATSERSYWLGPSLKLALPLAALIVVGFFWWNSATEPSIEDQLSKISVDQLIVYSDNNDFILELDEDEEVLSEEELNELEDKVYSSMDIMNQPIEDYLIEEIEINTDNF
jgi:hypothetical protein